MLVVESQFNPARQADWSIYQVSKLSGPTPKLAHAEAWSSRPQLNWVWKHYNLYSYNKLFALLTLSLFS